LASAVLGFSWSASTARMLKSALRRLRKGLKGARCDSSVLCLTPTLPQHPTSLRDCARLPFHVLGTTRRRSRIAPWSVPESVTSENCCNRTARITKCKTQNVDSCRFPMIELAGLHERLRGEAPVLQIRDQSWNRSIPAIGTGRAQEPHSGMTSRKSACSRSISRDTTHPIHVSPQTTA